MESTVHRPHQTVASAPNATVYADELLSALEYFAPNIKVLSLDCFDTLLWRKTATPSDVFYELQHKPAFQALKLNPTLRVRIEAQARNLNIINKSSSEVTLADIYRAGYPRLSEQEIAELSAQELEAEIAACFGFEPIINLLRSAHNLGLKVVITSNTYLQKNQLALLLQKILPSDVFHMLSDIYCSCEYGVSKNNGLFRHVLQHLNYIGSQVLHIGDDAHADYLAARAYNIHALHMIAYDKTIIDLLRLHAASAVLFNPDIRYKQPIHSPFRALFAQQRIDTPEKIIGYASVGPIMHAFVEFIRREYLALQGQGKKAKILFLMRDAYLPSRVYQALYGQQDGVAVRISRFVAYAASFRTKEDIHRYLSDMVISQRFKDMGKQLLLPNEIIEPLIQVVESSESPIMEFMRQIQSEAITNIILKKSALYRQRLIKYLHKHAHVQPGDTLMFVDLGYSGTAQKQLAPLLREELNVEIIGRYLLELNIPDWEQSRRGLLDPASCDDRILLTLVNYIAIFEQICTANERSVIDYDEQGDPIFSEQGLDTKQYFKLDAIQECCLRFVQDANLFLKQVAVTPEILRNIALAELGRLIFLPTESEINYLASFQFDLNMGAKDLYQVFNVEQGLQSLKKRGLFFTFMEKNQASFRTNHPAELRAAGLELAMTLLTQSRFAIELGLRDMSLRKEALEVEVSQNNQIATTSIDAHLTYDGYFALVIPHTGTGFQVHISVGKKYHWLQFDSAELIAKNTFLNRFESSQAKDCWHNLIFHRMTEHENKLFFCTDSSAQVIIPPIIHNNSQEAVIRLIFRPIAVR